MNYLQSSLFISKGIDHYFLDRNENASDGSSLDFNDKELDQTIFENNIEKVKKEFRYKNLFLLDQTHSNVPILLTKRNIIKSLNIQADAIVTQLNDVLIGIKTADCVPILLMDEKSNTIAAIHAGWRGAIGGIIENTIKMIYSINKQPRIIAAIGPSIQQYSYEVSEDIYNNFMKKNSFTSRYFMKHINNKYLFNLPAFCVDIMFDSNVKKISRIFSDTYSDNRFFSYRRSLKNSQNSYCGRNLSLIGMPK